MDTVEKQIAKQQLDILKAINRNINYLGRKLEETNKILAKYGIAVIPGVVEEIKKGDTNETEE